MKIDYCTVMVHPNEMEVLSLHLKSLYHHCGRELFNVKVSIPEENKIMAEFLEENFDDIEIFKEEMFVQKANPGNGLNQAGYDTCNRIHKMTDTCKSEWVCVAHADIVYTGSILMAVRKRMESPKAGMIGNWPEGVTFLNRAAYDACHFKFWPLPNIFLFKDQGTLRVRGFYERGPMDEQIDSIDLCGMLVLEMQAYGYFFSRIEKVPLIHLGGQSQHALKVIPEERRGPHLKYLDEVRLMTLRTQGHKYGL